MNVAEVMGGLMTADQIQALEQSLAAGSGSYWTDRKFAFLDNTHTGHFRGRIAELEAALRDLVIEMADAPFRDASAQAAYDRARKLLMGA